jgi:hypothetical protein
MTGNVSDALTGGNIGADEKQARTVIQRLEIRK